MGDVLYSVARTESGEIVKAADAEKAEPYFCGFCSSPCFLEMRKNGTGLRRLLAPIGGHMIKKYA